MQYLVNSCIIQAEQCSSDFEIFVCSQIFVKRWHLNQSTDMLQIIPPVSYTQLDVYKRQELKLAVVNGLANAKKLLKEIDEGKKFYHLIERCV